jgi:hypothetical protein
MSVGIPIPGQQFDESLNIIKQFTQQMDAVVPTVNGIIGTNDIEITPNDAGSCQTRTWNAAQIATAMEGIVELFPAMISLDLPDELLNVTVVYNTTTGDGSSSQTATGGSEGNYGSLSMSLHATGQGSVSIQPELQYSLKVIAKDNIPAMVAVFFIQSPTTMADILTKLSSAAVFNAVVSLIPLFTKSINTVSLLSQNASVSATADVQERVEFNLSSSASNVTQTIGSGTGNSVSFGTNNRTIQLPAAINAGFSIAGTNTAAATASATSAITAGTNWDAVSETETVGPITVTATVGPDVPATSQTTIPTSGFYLVKMDATPFSGFGFNMARCVVVDFSVFA